MSKATLFCLLSAGLFGTLWFSAGLSTVACAAPAAGDTADISYGDYVEAIIGLDEEVDLFRFEGLAGDSVIIQMHRVSGALSPQLELFAPNDSLVQEASGTSHETIVDYSLPYSGTYTLLASDYLGGETGDYWLTLQCRQHVQASADTVVYDSVTDTLLIDPYGDMDAFVFVGGVGDSVIIQVHRVSGTFYPRLELFAPGGNLVEDVWGSGSNQRISDFSLPDSGSYTLFVRDYIGDKTGDYWVSLQCRQHVRASAGTIVYDSWTDGLVIDPYGDIDAYVFEGTAGDSVIIQMHRVSGTLAPKMELFAPNDGLVEETGGTSHETIVDFSLPYSGSYTLFASDNDGDETADYWLSLQCRQHVRASADTIVYGSVTDTLSIGPYGDLDAFVFVGDVGDSVIIQAHRVSGTFYPRLELFDPDGGLIEDVWGSGPNKSITDFPLPDSGSYTLFVRDYIGDKTGDYWVSLQCRQHVRASADTIVYDSWTDGLVIDPYGDIDAYMFEGTAGDSVIIQMHRVSGTLVPRMELFAPNDSLVEETGGATHETIVDYSLPYSGTYSLFASDNDGDGTGDYWLSLQCRQHVRASADTIVYDSVTDTLSIDPYGDLDAFVFVGDIGDSVRIHVHRVSGGFYPRLELFAPNDSLVQDVWGVGSNKSIEDYSLPDSGSYTLFVRDYIGDKTGDYWVSLQCRQHVRASADTIVYDSWTDGLLIDPYGDIDAYVFEGTAGDSVIIQMHRVSGTLAPKMELFAPNDSFIEETSGTSHVSIVDYSLPYSGTYSLFASDDDGDGTGDYWLSLQCRQHVRASADTIVYDSLTDGLSIDPYGDLDAFVFVGDVGDSVIIQVHRVSGGFYPRLELFDPDGGLVQDVWGSGANKSIEDCSLPDSGSYTLFVRDYIGDKTGDYWVSLQCRQHVKASADTIVYDSWTDGLLIDPYGDMDAYVFEGAAGDSVIIQMHRVSGTLAPKMELFAPNDSLVEEKSGTSHVSIVDYSLPYSGTYTLFASDNDGDGTGDYWVSLQCRQHVQAGADTIVYDSLTDGLVIDPCGDMDAFVFVGDIGDSVIIQAHRVSGTFYPRLELFDPDGGLVQDVWGIGANKSIEDYSLPDSGSYTLFVSDHVGDKTGDYWVSLQCRQHVRATAETIVYDSWTDGLLIDPYGDMDAYVFEGTAGDSVIIQMHRTSGTLAPKMELFAPNDGLVEERSGTSHVSIVDYSLPYSGIYTLFASDNDGDETGDYWVTLQCRQHVRASADTIVYDSLADPLSIEPYGDLDGFVFEGSAGDLVIIQMHRVSGTVYPRLELFAPNDSLVQDVWGSASHQKIFDFSLPYSGNYTLFTRDYAGDKIGDYWLSLQCRQHIRANADTLLDRDGTIVRTLDEYGDWKAYVFPAIKDDTTSLMMMKVSGDINPCMELYGPSDTLIVRVHGYTDVEIGNTYFTEYGVYTLFVCDNEGDGTGSYELSWNGFFRGGSIGVDPPPKPVPQEYRAHQSYPNPFNPLCNIRFEIPKAGRVSLRIFDVSGSLVRTLVDGWKEPGSYREVWNGTNQRGDELPSGVYFYCLESGNFVATKKMVLLR
ncbi:MAG: hypothetical protein AMJ46_08395 [Latescibacteria bacterium DG_63]|nr:MAG: hypothetical protein AMJ46_08395 [Latescibacteria bacterium DG_63]